MLRRRKTRRPRNRRKPRERRKESTTRQTRARSNRLTRGDRRAAKDRRRGERSRLCGEKRERAGERTRGGEARREGFLPSCLSGEKTGGRRRTERGSKSLHYGKSDVEKPAWSAAEKRGKGRLFSTIHAEKNEQPSIGRLQPAESTEAYLNRTRLLAVSLLESLFVLSSYQVRTDRFEDASKKRVADDFTQNESRRALAALCVCALFSKHCLPPSFPASGLLEFSFFFSPKAGRTLLTFAAGDPARRQLPSSARGLDEMRSTPLSSTECLPRRRKWQRLCFSIFLFPPSLHKKTSSAFSTVPECVSSFFFTGRCGASSQR
ncbi:hypothetical protein TGARI_356940 [Toxoplasma gondii ARI]|uniref:Uncharacterized protein n=1 Tax=Toxoplasma gondii ARI TaxID=1074872 RepID=A0A139XT55_TOXGO|nr:hypothetical protein TGARI_356940 [Toxoplasma gondii ARI]